MQRFEKHFTNTSISEIYIHVVSDINVATLNITWLSDHQAMKKFYFDSCFNFLSQSFY